VLSWLTNKVKSRSEALCALLLSDMPGDTEARICIASLRGSMLIGSR
jgi:hypothetical protein